jgi:hypothetical protein
MASCVRNEAASLKIGFQACPALFGRRAFAAFPAKLLRLKRIVTILYTNPRGLNSGKSACAEKAISRINLDKNCTVPFPETNKQFIPADNNREINRRRELI